MALKLSRGEYWVLETAAEGQWPIDYLFSDDVEIALNKTTHGLAEAELFEVLFSLHTQNKIFFYQYKKIIRKPHINFLSDYLKLKLPPTEKKKRIYYGLTELRGKAWEEFARPNWDSYISALYEFPDQEDGFQLAEIICANKLLLERYISSIEFHDMDIMKETKINDILEPWDATYWKTLPVGYRTRFKCKDKLKERGKPPTSSFYKNLWYDWG